MEEPGWIFIIFEWYSALEKNDRTKAAALIETISNPDGNYPDDTMMRIVELLRMDEKEAALAELKEISKNDDNTAVTRIFLRDVALELGDAELAFDNYRTKQRIYSRPLVSK